MSNTQINCPRCRGAITLPPGMEGQTVGCPHCKQPFQLPGDNAPDFAAVIPDGPRRRSPGRSPGSNPLLWIAIIAPFAGVLLVVLLLSKGGSKQLSDLNKARIRTTYADIVQGMDGDEAVKRVKKILADLPGKQDEYLIGEDDEDRDTIIHVFEKGDVTIRLSIHKTTNKVVTKANEGL